MSGRPEVVLFDLDGTLADSAQGILAALRHALHVHGIAPLDARTERSLLGPPWHDALVPLVGRELVPAVLTAYRARYTEIMSRTTAFPGMADLLRGLRRDGRRVAVATSKAEPIAVALMASIGLLDLVDTVCGDELDGSRGAKALVVGEALRRLDVSSPHAVVMVGDRSQDVVGARAHGIGVLAVGWGYAVPGELEATPPDRVCATPADLADALQVEIRAIA